MKKIEDILARCIEDIGAGRATLEDCLNRYPDVRGELEPLLKMAREIPAPPDVRPSEAFRIRTRVNLMESIHAGKSVARSAEVVRRRRPVSRFRALAMVLSVVLILFTLGTGTAYASQDSLPGETLYPVKLSTEQVRRVFVSDSAERVALELKFAGTRLDEIAALAGSNPSGVATAVTGYERNLNLAFTWADSSEKGAVRAGVMETVALSTSNHLDILDSLEDTGAETVREIIRSAREITVNGHIRALQGLAAENPERATEIDLETIDGRLNRAKARAAANDIEAVTVALTHFERFNQLGQEIYQAALIQGRDVTAIEEMNARAGASHLAILNSINTAASAEIRAAVERSIRATGAGNGPVSTGETGGNGGEVTPAEPEPAGNQPADGQGQPETPGPTGSGKSGN